MTRRFGGNLAGDPVGGFSTPQAADSKGKVTRAAPPGAEASYRNKPSDAVPVHIAATAIDNPTGTASARRSETRDAAPKRKLIARNTWVAGWLIVTGIVVASTLLGAVQALLLPQSASARVGGWGYAAGLGLWAAVAAANLRLLPDFVVNNQLKSTRDGVILVWCLVAVIPLIAAATALTESVHLLTSGDAAAVSLTKRGTVAGLRVDMLRGYAVFLLLGVAVLAAVQWVVTRKSAIRSRMLLGAPTPEGALTAGSWALVEGTVRTDLPFVRQCVYSYLGKNQGSRSSCESHPFVLEATHGGIAVGKGGIWSTTERRRKDRSLFLSVEHGMRVILAGRLDRTDEGLSATGKGEESLLLYATKGESPQRDLRVTLLVRSLLVAVAALSLAAAAAVWLLPRA